MKKLFLIGILSFLATYTYGQKNFGRNAKPDSIRVLVSFIVEIDGTMTNVKIEKIECKKCSKAYKKNISDEALRIVKKTANLSEHKQRTKYTLPVKFNYED